MSGFSLRLRQRGGGGLILGPVVYHVVRNLGQRLVLHCRSRSRCSSFCQRTGARLLLLTLLALERQLLFLTPDEFSLPTRLFLAPRQFGMVDQRRIRRQLLNFGCRGVCTALGAVFAAHERTLLAHFDLNRARLAGGIGLLDFAGRFLDQRDLLALGRSGAVAGVQVVQQAVLV